MQVYLVMITTVLVLTQILRLIQNAISLSKHGEIDEMNKEVIEYNRETRANNKEVLEILRRLDKTINKI